MDMFCSICGDKAKYTWHQNRNADIDCIDGHFIAENHPWRGLSEKAGDSWCLTFPYSGRPTSLYCHSCGSLFREDESRLYCTNDKCTYRYGYLELKQTIELYPDDLSPLGEAGNNIWSIVFLK